MICYDSSSHTALVVARISTRFSVAATAAAAACRLSSQHTTAHREQIASLDCRKGARGTRDAVDARGRAVQAALARNKQR